MRTSLPFSSSLGEYPDIHVGMGSSDIASGILEELDIGGNLDFLRELLNVRIRLSGTPLVAG